MSNQGQFRWIVLINKSPRGPLTEVEVRTLMAQGVVRHNDLAYRIQLDRPEEKAEWKLLWQFPEFDRRTPENYAKKKPPVEKEKREVKPDEAELRQKTLGELPDDLIDIAPEDLLPRARSVATDENRWAEKVEDSGAQSGKSASRSGGWSFRVPSWTYGVLAASALSYGAMRMLSAHLSGAKLVTPTAGDNTLFVSPENRGTASAPVQHSGLPSNRGTVITSPPHANLSPRANPQSTSGLPTGRDSSDTPADRETDRERDKERELEERAVDEERAKEERTVDGEEKKEQESPAPASEKSTPPPSEENPEREERSQE